MNERTRRLQETLQQQLKAIRRRLLQRGRLIARDEELEELIQDAFVQLYHYGSDREKPAVRDPVEFLVHVVENLQVDRARRAARTSRLFSSQPLEDLEPLLEAASTPQQDAEADELIERVIHRLAMAHPSTRDVFFLYRVEGLSYAQIAQELNISPRAVKRHIAKAMLIYDAELEAT